MQLDHIDTVIFVQWSYKPFFAFAFKRPCNLRASLRECLAWLRRWSHSWLCMRKCTKTCIGISCGCHSGVRPVPSTPSIHRWVHLLQIRITATTSHALQQASDVRMSDKPEFVTHTIHTICTDIHTDAVRKVAFSSSAPQISNLTYLFLSHNRNTALETPVPLPDRPQVSPKLVSTAQCCNPCRITPQGCASALHYI